MCGRRRKRGARLPRQLALGRLEEAMARAEQQQAEGEPETVPYPPDPPASNPAPGGPAARPRLLAKDVPLDNSAGPEQHNEQHRELPVRRTRDSTRHGTF